MSGRSVAANELFARADRAYSETLRLLGERTVCAEQTLTVLHQCVESHEETLDLLGLSIQRLARAGRGSVIVAALADARQTLAYRALTRRPLDLGVNGCRIGALSTNSTELT